MEKTPLLKDETGSVIVLALIMLVILTLMGISATTTSTIEVQIAGNEYKYKRNLYTAEAAAMQSAQMIENAGETQLKDRTFSAFTWLKKAGSTQATGITDPDNWSTGTNSAAASTLDSSNTTFYAAVEEGISRGASVSMTDTTLLYEYSIYGLCQSRGGESMIHMGYKKRF